MAPRILLARHGQTEWSLSGRHTGRTDIPLLEEGRRGAKLLGERLHRAPFDGLPGVEVRTSPLARARETCELAGLGERAGVWDTLMEWDYGDYEGMTSAEIEAVRPGWLLWRDGVPGGESIAEVSARADEVVAWARSADREVLVFAHGHVLRSIGARWLGLPLEFGAHIRLNPTSLSVLGWAYGEPAIESWNDTGRGRLIPVKKYAQQAATAEGVRRLLVANAHHSAQAALAPEAAHPGLGRVRLAALWAELSRDRETSLVVSELAGMLWNTTAPGTCTIEQTQDSGARADERSEFAEVVSWVLLDYAYLGLLAINPDQTLVQLTPTGGREYDERLAPTAEASPS